MVNHSSMQKNVIQTPVKNTRYECEKRKGEKKKKLDIYSFMFVGCHHFKSMQMYSYFIFRVSQDSFSDIIVIAVMSTNFTNPKFKPNKKLSYNIYIVRKVYSG